MQMIRRFFPLPSLPACSTAKLTEARKLGLDTTSGVSGVLTGKKYAYKFSSNWQVLKFFKGITYTMQATAAFRSK